MSNSLKEAFQNLASSLGHCQENSRSIVDVLKRGCTDLANNSEGGSGGGSSDYSTDEVVIGKWIDGTSDVCRRVFTNLTSNLAGDDWVIINGVTIPNLQYVLNVNAYRIADDTYAGLPIIETMAYTNNSVRVSSVSGQTGTIKMAIITYVKTA